MVELIESSQNERRNSHSQSGCGFFFAIVAVFVAVVFFSSFNTLLLFGNSVFFFYFSLPTKRYLCVVLMPFAVIALADLKLLFPACPHPLAVCHSLVCVSPVSCEIRSFALSLSALGTLLATNRKAL